MSESYVQIAADGAGKKIRNLKITERAVDVDGGETFVDRYAQVVAITSEGGQLLDFDLSDLLVLLKDIRAELTMMNLQMRAGFEGSLANVKQEIHDLRAAADAVVDEMETFR